VREPAFSDWIMHQRRPTPGLPCVPFTVLVLISAACARTPQPGATADTALVADTVFAAPPRPAALDTAGATPATVPITPFDSLRAEIGSLTGRVDALIRVNDSLRSSLVAGSPAAAPGSPSAAAGSQAAPPSGSAAAQSASGQAILQEAGETARNYGPRAFWTIIILLITFYTVRLTVYIVDRLAERNAQRRLFFKRLVPIARILFWTISLVFIVRVVFAVDARGLLTAMAAIGVAIGFAAQDILKNIFGGLVIVFDQPFQVGDKIQVAGSYGEVVSIGLRSTRIVTPDDSLVTVPNAQIVDGQVSNANSGALDCQVVTDLYLPGWVDEAVAKRIAFQATASSRYVHLKKPIVVLVRDEYEDTFVIHLKVKAYVIDTRYEFPFMSEVTERARAEFRRQGLLPPWHGARAWVDVSPTAAPDRTAPYRRSNGDVV
jgi:small-conductance mechanosensitive channel